jgi:hypothetical protein
MNFKLKIFNLKFSLDSQGINSILPRKGQMKIAPQFIAGYEEEINLESRRDD